MADKDLKKAESESPSGPPPLASVIEAPEDVPQEKTVIPPPPTAEKPPVVDKTPESLEEKSSGCFINRDDVLARVETEKRLSLIRAWEESEKSKAENKAQKKLSAIGAWENSERASLEAELKKTEEKLEKLRAEYVEKMKNKMALVHKEAEEKRAIIEAKRGEDLLKAEEIAAKYRATGIGPKKLLGCF